MVNLKHNYSFFKTNFHLRMVGVVHCSLLTDLNLIIDVCNNSDKAQWMRLHLTFCGLRFESHAHHLCLFIYNRIFTIFVIVLRKEGKLTKEAEFGSFKKQFGQSKRFMRDINQRTSVTRKK